MSSKHFVALLFVAATAAACHHDKAQTTTASTTPPPPATTETQPPKQTDAQQPVSQNITAGDDLIAKCKIHFSNTTEAPKFDYDRAELTTEDRSVLEQIATCVTTGPLKGKTVKLTGRADPRGTEEYNLSLGDRRAHQVEAYLTRLGLPTNQVASTTRGALDASGTDESGYKTDRRVDIAVQD